MYASNTGNIILHYVDESFEASLRLASFSPFIIGVITLTALPFVYSRNILRAVIKLHLKSRRVILF